MAGPVSMPAMVSLDVLLWVALVVTMAAWLLVHASLLVRTARMPGLTPVQRLMTVAVPPLTPVFGFRLGARRRSVLWWVLVIIYVLLRSIV